MLTSHCGIQLDINRLPIILTVKHFHQKCPLLRGTVLHPMLFFRIKSRRKVFLTSYARNSLTDGNQLLPCHRNKNRITKSHSVIYARIIHAQIAFRPSIWYTPSRSTTNVLPIHIVVFYALPSLFSFFSSVASFPTFGVPAPILCSLPHLLISSLQLLTTAHSIIHTNLCCSSICSKDSISH